MTMTMTKHKWIAVVLAVLAVSLPLVGQDQGFEIISETILEPSSGPSFDMALFGNAGYSVAGAFWASAGARIGFTVDDFEIFARASAGTDGTQFQGGVTTELFGFGTAGEVSYTLGGTPVISLRGWGDISGIGLTANATVAGTAVSVLVGGNMTFDTYGASASLGFANGTLSTASIGANTTMGAMSLSVNGGWTGGQFVAGGGLGIELGPFQITANAGYNSALGINAVGSAGLAWEAFQASAVAMFDNTGIGFEANALLSLGSLTLTTLARLGGTDLSWEVGGELIMGSLALSFSVAIDTNSGFSWAEVGFNLPL